MSNVIKVDKNLQPELLFHQSSLTRGFYVEHADSLTSEQQRIAASDPSVYVRIYLAHRIAEKRDVETEVQILLANDPSIAVMDALIRSLRAAPPQYVSTQVVEAVVTGLKAHPQHTCSYLDEAHLLWLLNSDSEDVDIVLNRLDY